MLAGKEIVIETISDGIRKNLLGFTPLIFFLCPPAWSAPLDSGFLDFPTAPIASPSPQVQEPAAGPGRGSRKGTSVLNQLPAGSDGGDRSSESSYNTITSLTQVLKITPPGVQRNLMLLNRAAAMNSYGRRLLMATTVSGSIKKASEFFSAAVRDITEVLKSKTKTPEQIVRAHNLLGFSNIYLDNQEEAIANFLKVLKLNPAVENAGWIGLYLAEENFEEGNFREAAKFYNLYYSKMSPVSKEIALYKSAWCMINLHEQGKAEDLFVRLASSKSKSGLALDSVRDLAFVVTHDSKPSDAIARTQVRFKGPVEKLEFLGYVRENLEGLGAVGLHTQVVEQLLLLEKNPEKRLEYLVAELKAQRKEFASRQHLAAFHRLSAMIKDENLSPQSKAVKKFADSLQVEVQSLIKTFIDAFAGRAKTPENFSKEQLRDELKIQFQFFAEMLPEATLRPKIVNLWLDVCVDAADWNCVDHVSELVIAERKSLDPLVERAYINELAALDKLIPSLQGEPKTALEKRKLARLKEFVENFKNSKQWTRIARAFAELNMAKGAHREMIPVLDAIFGIEPNPENMLRLQYARFKAEDYTAVLAEARWDPKWEVSKNPELRKLFDLKRETVLALAMQARKAENAALYRKYILQFLQLNPDPAKATIARVDMLRFLMEKKSYDEATDEFLSTDPKILALPEFADAESSLWIQEMKRGRYVEARKILLAGSPKSPDLAYKKLINGIALGEIPAVTDLSTQTPANREYMLGLLAGLHPKQLLKYFFNTPPVNSSEKELGLLALRLVSGEWIIPKTREAEKILGAGYRFTGPDTAIRLPLEDRIKKVRFPAENAKGKGAAEAIQALLVETRKIRAEVPRAIQDKTAYQQFRLLEVAGDLERRVGTAIQNAAIPDGLNEQQIVQYKEGVQEASREFVEQAAEFDRQGALAREATVKVRDLVKARLLPRPDPRDWKWPAYYHSDPVLKRVSDAVGAGNRFAALALLDFFRAETVKNDADYFRIRAGILFSQSLNDAERIYVLDDLEAHQRFEIINDWKKLVSLPVSVPSSSPIPSPSAAIPHSPVPIVSSAPVPSPIPSPAPSATLSGTEKSQ